MSLIGILARMEAMEAGSARPLTTVRHRHLAEHPLVLVPLTTAGEAGAPLGAMVGTDRENPVLFTVGQPRDRDLRFAFLAALADVMLPHLESALDATEPVAAPRGAAARAGPAPAGGRSTDPDSAESARELCTDAPQVVVPNRAGMEFVRLLGRSMRFRRTREEDPDTTFPAPARVPLLGRWLTHYGERARVPGSSLLLAVTELLNRHWATGQSVLEDQHLGALLAWHRPGGEGAAAALRAETARGRDGLLHTPPAGPATDPVFDNTRLAPAVRRFDERRPGAATEVEALLASQLRPTWDAAWEGLDLVRALPAGDRVASRWEGDRWSYTGHRDRLRAGEPPQPRRDDAVTAARKLAARERDQARLAAHEALDDPLVMAARRLAGEAFTGVVTEVAPAYSEGRRPMPRPLVTVRTTDRPQLGERTAVFRPLPEGRSQSGEFAAAPGPGLLTVQLTGGMGRSREPAPGTVPEPGEAVCFTLFPHTQRGGPDLPDPEDTPWTHGGPPGSTDSSPDPSTPEDLL